MRVLLRCDSSKAQGLGHVVRTMAVAEAALAAGWDVVFSGDVESAMGRELVEARCPVRYARPDSAEDLVQLAREAEADVVHIDTYAEQGEARALLNEAGILLSSMEDGPFGRRPADLAVDPSPAAETRYRPADGSHRLLRGAAAIPIRGAIRALPTASPRPADAEPGKPNMMIVMGGTDARDMTARCLGWWAQTGIPSRCFVVSAGRPEVPVALGEGQELEIVPPALDLPKLFPSMDLVLSGAGTTTWELAALGVPTALVQLVENQGDNYRFATSEGMAAGLGDASSGELDEGLATAGLRQLLTDTESRERLSARSRELVDGAGADRIVAAWAEIIEAPPGLSARPARIEDASQLFDWRNEPSVRKVSRTRNELSWDSHVAWVAAAVANPEVCLLIAEMDGAPAGTVRFHALDPLNWEVSITVGASMRGRRLAGPMLHEAERFFCSKYPGKTLHAAMLASNQPSLRLFQAAGYTGGLSRIDNEDWYELTKAGD